MLVGLVGLALLLALAYWWAARQDTEPVATPIRSETTTTAPPPPAAVPSSLRIERQGTSILLEGTIKTESEREALAAAIVTAGYEVDNRAIISDRVTDSDPRVVATILAPLLDGTDDGELSLLDGTVTITGEAFDPVEADEIRAAIETSTAAGLSVDDQTTIRVLPEAVQIEALQEEIDQIFELARAIDGQYPNFGESLEELTPGAQMTLERVSVAMRRYPLPAADIIGHTDSIGSAADNQALSESRAQTVMTYLVELEVEPDRLQAIGRGEAEPVAENDTEEGRAENRRVDFAIKKRES